MENIKHENSLSNSLHVLFIGGGGTLEINVGRRVKGENKHSDHPTNFFLKLEHQTWVHHTEYNLDSFVPMLRAHNQFFLPLPHQAHIKHNNLSKVSMQTSKPANQKCEYHAYIFMSIFTLLTDVRLLLQLNKNTKIYTIKIRESLVQKLKEDKQFYRVDFTS